MTRSIGATVTSESCQRVSSVSSVASSLTGVRICAGVMAVRMVATAMVLSSRPKTDLPLVLGMRDLRFVFARSRRPDARVKKMTWIRRMAESVACRPLKPGNVTQKVISGQSEMSSDGAVPVASASSNCL